MKAKITSPFSCYHKGNKLVFKPGDVAVGWPAERAIAAGKAKKHTEKKAMNAAPENK